MLLAAALWVVPYASRSDLFYDDATQHIFWLYRYADPGLFPGDLTVDYFRTSAPWGYRALYACLAPVVDVLSAAEWLSAGLLLACGWFAWNIGRAVSLRSPESHALLVVVALVALLPLSQQRDLLPPIAFQRTFALPLLLMTLWALVCRRYAWVGMSWLVAAVVYPVVLPVQGLTAALVFLRELVTDRRMPAKWIFNALAGGVALLIAGLALPAPAGIGPPYTYEQAILMPEFGPGGRLNLYEASIVGRWFTGHRTGIGWSPVVLMMFSAGAFAAWRLRWATAIPWPAWAMAAVGVGLWALMRLFPEQLMFGLYLPNRHSRWALGILGILLLAAGGSAVLEILLARRRDPARGRRAVAILAPVVVVAALLPNALQAWQTPTDRDRENVYGFLATLPDATLVAAHPDLANDVPLRAHRSVLASTEASMSWMAGYYDRMTPRLQASLRAAFATSIEEMDEVLEPYGVDVMLTGPQAWSRDRYFEPYDRLYRALLVRGKRDGFALKSPPPERVLFRSGEYFVIRVDKCVSPDCQ